MGLLDEHRLDAAIEQKVIVPLHKAWSLQEALVFELYDRRTGLLALGVVGAEEKMTLQTAIQKGLITKSALTVKDPRSSDMLTLADAIFEWVSSTMFSAWLSTHQQEQKWILF